MLILGDAGRYALWFSGLVEHRARAGFALLEFLGSLAKDNLSKNRNLEHIWGTSQEFII